MYSYPNSRQHILVYLIPGLGGNTANPNELRINWVWYRNKEFESTMTDKMVNCERILCLRDTYPRQPKVP